MTNKPLEEFAHAVRISDKSVLYNDADKIFKLVQALLEWTNTNPKFPYTVECFYDEWPYPFGDDDPSKGIAIKLTPKELPNE